MGDPTEELDHIIGPLINDRQADRVKHQIEDAVKRAKIELGGKVNGRFVDLYNYKYYFGYVALSG